MVSWPTKLFANLHLPLSLPEKQITDPSLRAIHEKGQTNIFVGKLDEAYLCFERLESLDVRCYGLVCTIARGFRRKKRSADAIRVLEKSVALGESRDATDPKMLCHVMSLLATCYMKINDWDRGIENLEKAMKIFPNPKTGMMLGMAQISNDLRDNN